MNQGLPREEKLKSRKQIRSLFLKNQHVFAYPFKLICNTADPNSPARVKILVSVSKRTFKHAVDRNRMKRLIREAYRKNKASLVNTLANQGITLNIGILFVGKDLMDYKQVEKGMIKVITKLEQEILPKL